MPKVVTINTPAEKAGIKKVCRKRRAENAEREKLGGYNESRKKLYLRDSGQII